ncbi:hypothetical protein B0H13DRAFT_1574419, partial [Mycena leptocephala]
CLGICRRQNAPISTTKIHNRWVQTINNRLEQDRRMTNPKCKTKAFSRLKVIRTKVCTLKDEMYLLPDWSRQNGVLVGTD